MLPDLGKEAADMIAKARKDVPDAGEVTFKVYTGEGHGACEEELRDLAKFFEKNLK